MLHYSETDIAAIYERQWETIYRICYIYMKNKSDSEDMMQDTFCQMIRKGPEFKNDRHEKAWLVKTAGNLCKNALKTKKRWTKWDEHIEYEEISDERIHDETLAVVLMLPERYKTVIYLYYYEGYSSPEIAELLKKPSSTIRNHLHEARNLLREQIGGDTFGK